ncbi:hypothetical protein [Clostridium sp. DMHC 10]|uniref:hypothetical protein n=1 Tax=Clostridium sp. DMHC 10 TaxID=747377 RepID=UPI00069F6285|nr:hypothetical protein [Clostridium sp. DMHC 10]
MERWDVYLAKVLKARDNIDYIGAVVGKVLNINPIKIGILDDNILLDEGHIHICASLKELYINDKVLVISSEDNQNFFYYRQTFVREVLTCSLK